MSIETLIGVSASGWSVAETVGLIHAALSSCQSVRGLLSVHRVSGDSNVDPKWEPIISVPDGTFIDDSALAAAANEINESIQGLSASWEVARFKGKRNESWSYRLEFLYEPKHYRSEVFRTLGFDFFIDAGLQRYYRPKLRHNGVGAQAAALNLESLVDEMEAIAAIPVPRLAGIPVHILDPECPSPLSSTWLFFDEKTHHEESGNVGIRNTKSGPLYYSPAGPLGDLGSLGLEGTLT